MRTILFFILMKLVHIHTTLEGTEVFEPDWVHMVLFVIAIAGDTAANRNIRL